MLTIKLLFAQSWMYVSRDAKQQQQQQLPCGWKSKSNYYHADEIARLSNIGNR